MSLFLGVSLFLFQGCETLKVGGTKVVDAGQPVPDWYKRLVAKYTEPVKGSKDLKFIHDYYEKYPIGTIPYAYVGALKTFESTLKERYDKEQANHTAELDRFLLERERLTLLVITGEKNDLEAINKRVAEIDGAVKAVRARISKTDLDFCQKRISLLQKQFPELAGADAPKIPLERQIQEASERLEAALREHDPEQQASALKAMNTALDRLGVGASALTRLEVMRIERNRITAELMIVAKRIHLQKDAYLHYGRSLVNMMGDSLQLGATGAASVVGAESTARFLAAFATVVKGEQESIDKRVFYEHATTALLSVRHTQRMKCEETLLRNMTLSVQEYPLEQAVADATNYALAGSLTDALRELGSVARERENFALTSLEELKKLGAEATKRREAEAARKAEEEAARKAQFQKTIESVMGLISPSIATAATP